MGTYHGDLLLDEKIVPRGIEYWVEMMPATPPSKLYEWHGSFDTIKGTKSGPVYDLRLDDGRRGKLFATKPGGESYIFQETVDLK